MYNLWFTVLRAEFLEVLFFQHATVFNLAPSSVMSEINIRFNFDYFDAFMTCIIFYFWNKNQLALMFTQLLSHFEQLQL